MKTSYRIVYHVTDPFVRSRVAIGAVVEAKHGASFIRVPELPSKSCIGKAASFLIERACYHLDAHPDLRVLPPAVGALFEFGPENTTPDVASPEKWLASVFSPTPHTDPVVEERTDDPVHVSHRRATVGMLMLRQLGVAERVRSAFKPSASSRVRTSIESLAAITHYAEGPKAVMLMEPIAVVGFDFKSQVRDAVNHLVAYQAALARGSLSLADGVTLSTHVYVVDARRGDEIDAVAKACEGLVDQCVNLATVGNRERFTRQITSATSGEPLTLS